MGLCRAARLAQRDSGGRKIEWDILVTVEVTLCGISLRGFPDLSSSGAGIVRMGGGLGD
jgi:hypothetical protein